MGVTISLHSVAILPHLHRCGAQSGPHPSAAFVSLCTLSTVTVGSGFPHLILSAKSPTILRPTACVATRTPASGAQSAAKCNATGWHVHLCEACTRQHHLFYSSFFTRQTAHLPTPPCPFPFPSTYAVTTRVTQDVRMWVACCLSELMRVYAPNAPYTNPEVKVRPTVVFSLAFLTAATTLLCLF